MDKQAITKIILAIIFVVVVYVGYEAVKGLGYRLCYEDMVKETVIEMVKPEYLKSDEL